MKTGRTPERLARTSRLKSALVTNGISHARNSAPANRVVVKAVTMPLIGPHRIIVSRRITRTGQPVLVAVDRTSDNMLRLLRRNLALSKPIRLLSPPARITTSMSGKFALCGLPVFFMRDHDGLSAS